MNPEAQAMQQGTHTSASSGTHRRSASPGPTHLSCSSSFYNGPSYSQGHYPIRSFFGTAIPSGYQSEELLGVFGSTGAPTLSGTPHFPHPSSSSSSINPHGNHGTENHGALGWTGSGTGMGTSSSSIHQLPPAFTHAGSSGHCISFSAFGTSNTFDDRSDWHRVRSHHIQSDRHRQRSYYESGAHGPSTDDSFERWTRLRSTIASDMNRTRSFSPFGSTKAARSRSRSRQRGSRSRSREPVSGRSWERRCSSTLLTLSEQQEALRDPLELMDGGNGDVSSSCAAAAGRRRREGGHSDSSSSLAAHERLSCSTNVSRGSSRPYATQRSRETLLDIRLQRKRSSSLPASQGLVRVSS